MIIFRPGSVVLVRFPFSDLSETKPRPALIVGNQHACDGLADIILCQITSKKLRYSNPGLGDLPLENWREAGLLLPSTVRLAKIVTLSKEMVLSELGRLTPLDMKRVVSNLPTVFCQENVILE